MNVKNTAIKRILADVRELQKHPTSRFTAAPLEDNLFEWHFTIRGPTQTEFEGGLYHGRILLSPEYPFKPPNIVFLTRNGRFEVGTKICLSISAYHEETWQPAWGVRTMLEAIISFLPTEGAGAIGALDWSKKERQRCSKESLSFVCPLCGPITSQISLTSDESDESNEQPSAEISAQVAQLKMAASSSSAVVATPTASSAQPTNRQSSFTTTTAAAEGSKDASSSNSVRTSVRNSSSNSSIEESISEHMEHNPDANHETSDTPSISGQPAALDKPENTESMGSNSVAYCTPIRSHVSTLPSLRVPSPSSSLKATTSTSSPAVEITAGANNNANNNSSHSSVAAGASVGIGVGVSLDNMAGMRIVTPDSVRIVRRRVHNARSQDPTTRLNHVDTTSASEAEGTTQTQAQIDETTTSTPTATTTTPANAVNTRHPLTDEQRRLLLQRQMANAHPPPPDRIDQLLTYLLIIIGTLIVLLFFVRYAESLK